MRRLPVTQLVPGMKVGQNVYGKDGQIWLGKGIKLTRRYIERLIELQIPTIYIDYGLLGDVDIGDVIIEETRYEAVQQVKHLLLEVPESKSGTINPSPKVYGTVESIVRQALGSPDAMHNLMDIRAEDEYLFYHSVNVCILSVMAGVTLGSSKEKLTELGMGALLHDVGKVRVPPDIINKPGELTEKEFDEVKRHTIYGAELLRELPTARIIARCHHERLNGEGYPDGLTNGDIPDVAQIAGMADVYDALTADRIYRKAYQPNEAFEMLSGTGGFWFDYKIVRAFLCNIAAFPIGSIVRLTSGAVALVLKNKPANSLYPFVRLLINEKGERSAPDEFWCYEVGLGVSKILTHKEVMALNITPYASA